MKRFCKNCEKEFEVKPHVVRNGFGLFCSPECRWDSLKISDELLEKIQRSFKSSKNNSYRDISERLGIKVGTVIKAIDLMLKK